MPTRNRRPAIERLEPRVLLSNQAIWIEGETPASTNWNHHSWIETQQLRLDQLSNNAWIGHQGSETNVNRNATYNFTVAEAGTYTFWIRVLTTVYGGNSGYSYSLNGGAYTNISITDVASQQNLTTTVDGFDNRAVGWVLVGDVNLPAGANSITIRLRATTGTTTVGGLDAIAFVNYEWAPTGPYRADPNAPAPAPDDWYRFGAGPDRFSSESIIDLSYLNEDVAGSHGYLQRQGGSYVFQDGTPVKFWGIDASPVTDPANIEAQARFYAKHGINIVRIAHLDGYLNSTTRDASGNFILDAAKLDRLDRFFAALKNNGIYTDWSVVWQTTIVPADGYPTGLYNELPNATGGKNTYGMVNVMPQLQDIRWKLMSQLLNRVNPYTGMRYADDPALAIVEVQNEDTVFFHNPLNNLAGTSYPLHRAEFQKQWQLWVKAKYGTNTALQAAWGSGFRTTSGGGWGPDGVDNLNMKVYGAWELQATGLFNASAELNRAGDYIKFLGDMQRDYYQRTIDRMRAVGFRGITVGTNWHAGGDSTKAPHLWTDATADATDRHTYWGEGEGSWRIVTTDVDGDGKPGEFSSNSMMYVPGQGLMNVGMYQWEDKPFNVSEWSSTPPNQYKAEAAPLMAFYGMGLNDWDASFHFASGRYYYGNGWGNTVYTSLYNSDTPHYMGQFPALALAARAGHIDSAAAATRRISYNNAFNGRDAFTQSITNGGWNGVTGNLSINNEVFAIGRVSNNIANGLPASTRVNWNTYWNSTNRTINSVTGQLAWNYSTGVVQVRAPRTQAVLGFAGGNNFDLPDFTVNVNTNFVSLIFTALDGKDIAESSHILVTAMARDRQDGAQYSPDGTQLLAPGGEPLMMEPVQATITMKGPYALTSVRPADVYGVPRQQLLPLSGNTFTIDGRYATHYYEIRRLADSTGPTASAVINDGHAQRSMITSVRVAFSERVTVAPGSITLLKADGSAVSGTLISISNTDQQNYVLSFTVAGVANSSLADGYYRVNVSAAGVSDLAANPMAADYTFSFHRLFGDANGDREITRLDATAFKLSMNKPANYKWYFDHNADSVIDALDYHQLKLRALTPVV